MNYIINSSFNIYCGFYINSQNIEDSIIQTNSQLSDLPVNFYQSVDLKTISTIVGAIFCATLAKNTGGIVNPIEKGHPDIIPKEAEKCSEEELRNYVQGIEVKCTVGNVRTGVNLRAGETRIHSLTSVTWQAHHREVKQLLGIVWDFLENNTSFKFPQITAIFYSNNLSVDDWGKISGTTGRNTKVTGMKSSGKLKMGQGWVAIVQQKSYISKYEKILKFKTIT